MQTALPHPISEEITIRLVTPVYFLATKFEALKGRGKNDLLSSRDVEDILNLIDGRAELHQEPSQTADDLKSYLIAEFKALLNSPDISYAVQSTAVMWGERV